MIHVIDYNLGNVGSVVNMLNYLGVNVVIAKTPKDLDNATKIILPGVGAFDAGANALQQTGLDEAIKQAVCSSDVMLLGICLGMQLLMEFSEEGQRQGLGLVAGHVKKIVVAHEKMRIPHMGWNTVEVVKNNRLLTDAFVDDRRFYFVHSYHVCCSNENDRVAITTYDSPFTSIIEKGRVMGVQFHPEKSHRYGKELLKNFLVAQ